MRPGFNFNFKQTSLIKTDDSRWQKDNKCFASNSNNVFPSVVFPMHPKANNKRTAGLCELQLQFDV